MVKYTNSYTVYNKFYQGSSFGIIGKVFQPAKIVYHYQYIMFEKNVF